MLQLHHESFTELGRAQHCIAQGNLRGAIEAYKNLLEERPDDMRMQERLASLLREDGQTDAARILYRMIARKWEADGYYFRAITNYRILSELEPQDLNARRHLAELSEALFLNDAAVHLYRGLADIFAAQGNKRRRVAMLERLVALCPDDLDTRLNYARELEAMGSIDEANAQIAEALRFCASQQLWQRYVPMAERYLERVPHNAEVRSTLAVAAAELERLSAPVTAVSSTNVADAQQDEHNANRQSPTGRSKRPDRLPNGKIVREVSLEQELEQHLDTMSSEESMLKALASIDSEQNDTTHVPVPAKGRLGAFFLRSFGPSSEVLLNASDHVVAAAIRARRRGDTSLALALLEDESAKTRPLSATFERALAYLDQEQWGEAMKLLTGLMDADLADSDRALVAYCLGVVAEMTHDTMLATVCFQQTERLCPGEAVDIPGRLARLNLS